MFVEHLQWTGNVLDAWDTAVNRTNSAYFHRILILLHWLNWVISMILENFLIDGAFFMLKLHLIVYRFETIFFLVVIPDF